MKTIKKLALILSVVMLLGTLSGCGNNSTDSSAAEPAQNSTNVESNWPADNTLNIIIPAKAGGVNDTIARIMQEYLQTNCGATVVINNYDTKAVAYAAEASAPNDGYSIMLQHSTIFPESAMGSSGVTPMKDIIPVAEINNLGSAAYIAPMDAPYNTFSELVAYAKEHPEEVTVAYAAGGMSHFQWGAIEQTAGIKLKMLDCSSESEKLTNVAGGFLDLASVTYPNAKEYADAGKLKIISVANMADAKEKGYESMEDLGFTTMTTNYMYIWVPAGVDQATMERINQVMTEMTDSADFKDKMNTTGFPAMTVSLGDVQANAEVEMDSATQLAKDLGLA